MSESNKWEFQIESANGSYQVCEITLRNSGTTSLGFGGRAVVELMFDAETMDVKFFVPVGGMSGLTLSVAAHQGLVGDSINEQGKWRDTGDDAKVNDVDLLGGASGFCDTVEEAINFAKAAIVDTAITQRQKETEREFATIA